MKTNGNGIVLAHSEKSQKLKIEKFRLTYAEFNNFAETMETYSKIDCISENLFEILVTEAGSSR